MKKYAALLVLFLTAAGCGYKISGKYTGIPEHIRVLAIPVFENKTYRARIEVPFTEATKERMIQLTKLRVTGNPADADAVLRCSLNSVNASTVGIRQGDMAVSYQLLVNVSVSLTEVKTGKVLYQNRSVMIREQIALPDQRREDFFVEDGPALRRAAEVFAGSLAAVLLENF